MMDSMTLKELPTQEANEEEESGGGIMVCAYGNNNESSEEESSDGGCTNRGRCYHVRRVCTRVQRSASGTIGNQ